MNDYSTAYRRVFSVLGVELTEDEAHQLSRLAGRIDRGGFDSATLMEDADGARHGALRLLEVSTSGLDAEDLEALGHVEVESIGRSVRSFQLFETELGEPPQLVPSVVVPIALAEDETTMLHFAVAGPERGALFIQWLEGQGGPFVDSLDALQQVTATLGARLDATEPPGD